MILLSAVELRKYFGPDPVLDGATFDVHPGQRIGLVGPNGAGKTTLLRILGGRDQADGGELRQHPSVRVGYLEQQPVFDPEQVLWDEAHKALEGLVALQRAAEEAAASLALAEDEGERQQLAARFDHLQQELHRQDAYNLDHQVERVLDGLRFDRSRFRQRVASLSGGEQNRLMLAKLLLADPELLLLDEPSNHLDLEATAWLEDYLAASSAAMIVVSHDRYFLDRVTTHTLELFRGTVEGYAGNFSAYWQQKEERLLVARRTYERQQEEIAKAEDFIRRNAYGQKHAQAEDRRKKLARIERVAAPREITAPRMRFAPAQRSGDIVLRVEGLAKSYDRTLFANLDFDVLRGQRWGLLGPNGSGKTTLLRVLLGEVEPDAGRAALGQGVQVGYFDQLLTSLEDALPVVDAVRPHGKDFVQQQRRDLLARFGIVGDTALQAVEQLSGGERCRAALARLAASDANFLILDEPTNHLDLWARDALETALREFDGTVLFVSHDRYFVDRVADHLLVLNSEQPRIVEGNYQAYLRLQESCRPSEREEVTPSNRERAVSPATTPAKPARRKRKFPYRKAADIEAEITRRESRIEEIHGLLAQPETHRDGGAVRQLKAELAEQSGNLETLYEHWEEAVEFNG